MNRLKSDFYSQDALVLGPLLLGKKLVYIDIYGEKVEYIITEVEVYRGEEDTACHASKGHTPRTEIMYADGGHVYVYLIYGMYWLLNIVTGTLNSPQAVLIRGFEGVSGPGRVGRVLKLDKSFYGEDLTTSKRMWLEDMPRVKNIIKTPRIGIDYASQEYKSKLWRYCIKK
jgi:DNA-3-methyladenine glycosylase